MSDIYTILLIQPITNLLLFFYALLSRIGIPGAFGISIIMLTSLVRVLLFPFYTKQMLLAKKMEEIKPQVEILSKKYKDDKKKLQEEQMKLYQKAQVNPASGCLLVIIQIPLFLGLYNVLQKFLNSGSLSKIGANINDLAYATFLKVSSIDPNFFGYNLAEVPSHFQKIGWHYLLIPVITGILQYFQFLATAPQQKPKAVNNKNETKTDDMSSIMTGQMKFMFPIMIGYFSYILPVGLSIYWNVFSIFSLIQAPKKKAI